MGGGSSIQERQALKRSRITSWQTRDRSCPIRRSSLQPLTPRPPGIEAAETDTVAARVDGGGANVGAFHESETTDLEVGRDEPAHFGGVRNLLECGEKLALLEPRLASRVRNRRLPDGEPSEGRLVLTSELLIRVPSTGLAVEVTGLDLPDIEHRHRRWRCRHHGVTVILAPLQSVSRRQTFGECRDLVVSVDDARASLGDFLRRDEIRAEDGLRQRVVGRLGREATEPSEQVCGEARVLVQDLCAVFVESGLVVLGPGTFRWLSVLSDCLPSPEQTCSMFVSLTSSPF